MASLPTVGESGSTWAAKLNTFLSVEHEADGTHKQNNGATTGIGLRIYAGGAVFTGNATSAATFQALDLSSIVGAKATLVIFEVELTGSTATNVVFMPTGHGCTWAEGYNSGGAGFNKAYLAADTGAKTYCACLTDSSGSVDWGQVTATSGYAIKIYVRAYIS